MPLFKNQFLSAFTIISHIRKIFKSFNSKHDVLKIIFFAGFLYIAI